MKLETFRQILFSSFHLLGALSGQNIFVHCIIDDVSTALGIVSSLVNCCCRASREAQNTFYRYSNTKIVDYYYSSAMQC